MNKGMQIFWIGILFLIVAGVGVSFFAKPVSGQLDDFAQCLTDKEAVFYGAFWCPHCQAQKRMFGNSVKLLPYVECSTPAESTPNVRRQENSTISHVGICRREPSDW